LLLQDRLGREDSFTRDTGEKRGELGVVGDVEELEAILVI
jgi:hypothetical protein